MTQIPLDQAIQIAIRHQQAGRLAEAQWICRQILAQLPDHVEGLQLSGALAAQAGRFDAAVELLRRVVRLKPDLAEAHLNLGVALKASGRLDEAIASYRQAIRLNPGLAAAHSNLGNALKDMEQHDEAIASYRQAIRLDPGSVEAHYNLGNAFNKIGLLGEAIASYRRAIQLRPDNTASHSNLVLTLHYHPDCDAKSIYDEARRWNQLHAEPLKKFIQPHLNSRDPDRRLRIGYMSPDLCDRVIGNSLLPLLRQHDHRQVEVFCYAHVVQPDVRTEQLRGSTDVWRDIVGVSDSQAVDLIRQDRIDILVDLALHTRDNRLAIFAYKPAPVQVTYLGYCGTTGLDAINYRLSDPYLDPPDSDLSCYSEQTIWLPKTYWCYGVFRPTPDPSPPPAAQAGYITFGCLNNSAKVSPAALDLWAQILQGNPRSRLLVHLHPGAYLDAVRERFARKGIASDRLEFLRRRPWPEYVRTYGRIDIALDPLPWGGGITTCDALWMGVPVVTLAGRTAVGRGGVSILTNIGLPELIAQDPQQYLQIATELAGDISRLSELRRTLRGRLERSPLMDAPRFARNIEAAYRQMWRNWCQGRETSGLQYPAT